MARYFAFQGIGHFTRSDVGDNPKEWSKWPYVVIMGPSGNLAQLLPPSGLSSSDEPPGWAHSFHSFENTLNHRPLAFYKNKLICSFRDDLNKEQTFRGWAWHPYFQVEGAKKTFDWQFDTNTELNNDLAFDGNQWENWSPKEIGTVGHGVFKKHSDGVFYYILNDRELPYLFGDWKAKSPEFQVNGIESGYPPKMGNYGNPGEIGDSAWAGLLGNGVATSPFVVAGVDYNRTNGAFPSDISFTPCDIVRLKDTLYLAGQFYVASFTFGSKGSIIHHDYGLDNKIDDFGGALSKGGIENYTSRASPGTLGVHMRSLAVHNNRVWMLQNDGKVFEIRPGGLLQRANLSTIGTPWGSGIDGGKLQETALSAEGNLDSPLHLRPFLASFNEQLHAFVNFQTTHQIGKPTDTATGKGHGVAWFTSHDGTNWHDRSEMLPSSGIQTPSGNTVDLPTWLTEINPYRFSALQGVSFPSGYGDNPPETGGVESNPSGFLQLGHLPFWTSGNLQDPVKTSFDSLNIPLSQGALSGYPFPTLVSYPSGYGFVHPSGFDQFGFLPQESGGVWKPIGIGTSGYDYTGTFNYHIGGHIDNDDPADKKLRLYFSRNFPGGISANDFQVPTLFYDLTENSGFIQRNESPFCGQLNGYEAIDLHDPEILIPSGDVREPNPKVDTKNKTARIKFQTIDWGYWDKVDVRVEYSLDNQTWATASTSGQIKNLDTGTKETDPSGVGIDPNSEHTIYWLYDKDLSKNEFFPNISIRMRAEVQ